jgi:hypothetical protein
MHLWLAGAVDDPRHVQLDGRPVCEGIVDKVRGEQANQSRAGHVGMN